VIEEPLSGEHAGPLVKACAQARVLMGAEDRFAEVAARAADIPAGGQDALNELSRRYDALKKNLQIEVGTLLKLDNVSFLLAAGCSMQMGGVGFGSIPYEVERDLLDQGLGEDEPSPWLELFYVAVKTIADKEAESQTGIRKQLVEALATLGLDARRRAAELRNESIPSELEGTIDEPACHKHLFPINFERFLTTLYGWDAALRSGAAKLQLDDGSFVVPEHLAILILRLKLALAKACALPKDGRKPTTHEALFRKLMTRPEKLRRVNLFTLNYDTLLEDAADAAGVILLDGFLGSIRRVFRPESFGFDFYFPGSTTEGKVHRLDRVAHLYKLHGSINWYRETPTEQNPFGIYSAIGKEAGSDALIFPTPVKQELATGVPYSEMFRRFSEAICQPQSVLFIVGYGFGDDHVNAIIRQALLVPSFRLVVVSPSGESEFLQKLVECKDPRIWLLTGYPESAGREALIGFGTFEAFVHNVLPDLQDESIRADMLRTYRTLATAPEEDKQHE